MAIKPESTQICLPGVVVDDDRNFVIPSRPVNAGSEDRVTGAIFGNSSAGNDRAYRYLLWRSWSSLVDTSPGEKGFHNRWCLFVMLNPSTADELTNDPTVERCERRARDYGFSGLIVANLFAYRSKNPAKLHDSSILPRGPRNDEAILYAARMADLVVCAWGAHGRLYDRGRKVLETLRAEKITPHCLRLVDDDVPEHPLYIPYSMKPVTFDVAPRGLKRGAAGRTKANGNG